MRWCTCIASIVSATLFGCSFAPAKSIEELLGAKWKVDRNANAINATLHQEDIWSVEAEVADLERKVDRLAVWLQTPEGQTVKENLIRLTVEASTIDKYGNTKGVVRLVALSMDVLELRRINHDLAPSFSINFAKVEFVDPRAIGGASDWCADHKRFAPDFCKQIEGKRRQ